METLLRWMRMTPNFFAILYLYTINTQYFNHPLSYIANSYIILESAMDMSDSNFLLHFRMEKDSFLNAS